MSDKKTGVFPPGIHTAIVTPFSGGGIDVTSFRELLRIQKNSAVSGVVVLGTTGEAPTVTAKEREELIKTAAAALGKKKTLTVGCGSNDTAQACEKVKEAAALGADFALVVAPYYNRPSQRGLLRHFITVADASPVPVIVYNVPSRTGADVSAETLSVLSSHPNVAAVKEASTDLQSVTSKMAEAPELHFFCGSDTLLLHFLCLGGKGGISVSSNLDPDKTCAVYERFAGGDLPGARDAFFSLYPYLKALGCDTNPVPIKAVMAARGLISAHVRQPLCELPEQVKAKLLYTASDAGIYVR
ncbi:MAG: 4-hydroxy-tetrahydrodipicolinate synthase [Clostridia bacterium]|nr:4-hydroxy-tetrahydrodipicolinate synthase [Clostridia bacterium]